MNIDAALLDLARAALRQAYAPYSGFPVGAVVRGASGRLYAGCNVENAAYPLGCCAETAAIAAMITAGERHIVEVAIIGQGDSLITPCGGCRQRLWEFASAATPVHLCNPTGVGRTVTLGELLPLPFESRRLSEQRGGGDDGVNRFTFDMKTRLRQLLSLLDLTSLNETDDAAAIARLCKRATTPFGNAAAVCVWPRFAPLCRERLQGGGVRVATVVNFPHGGADIAGALRETRQAIAAGADEVDIVFPYRCWLAGERDRACKLIEVCKQACGAEVILKVILETGALPTPAPIAAASRDAIRAGADFLKTSTGKVKTGATLAAATIMLAAIKETGAPVGFKAAGGVRAVQDALSYLTLAEGVMGGAWVRPATFRIGASALLDELLDGLRDDAASGNYPPQA